MRKNSRWLFAQADNYYTDELDWLFLISQNKRRHDIVWDMRGGEWILDGVGHTTFRLELIS